MENNNLKLEIIDYIAEDNRAFFKLQQIDDPEFTMLERKKILEDCLEQSHSRFLMRFGPYMKLEHAVYFDNPQNYSDDEQCQVEYYLNLIKLNNNFGKGAIRNRRYEFMNNSKDGGMYFNEIEMMKREPLLYHEFIGQYLTRSEIKIRDEEINKSFLNIIFASIDHNTANKLKCKQENEILMYQKDKSDEYETEECFTDQSKKHTSSFQNLWGEFNDNSPENQFNAQFTRNIIPISNEQRNFLRAEFIGIMQTKFLSGSDDNFDYTSIDLNDNYDNLENISRDEEDKYFDSEDVDESADASTQNENTSEDELDLYMKSLNKTLN